MALYTKKEFIDLLGIESKHYTTYVSRSKIFENADGFIDSTNQKNAAFIQKMQSKKANKGVKVENKPIKQPKEQTKKSVIQIEEPTEHEEYEAETAESLRKMSFELLEKHKIIADIEKKQADLEKVLLVNAKAKGQVIPFELMKPLITQNNQSLTTEFKNAADELILEVGKKKSLSSTEVAELNKKLIDVINNAIRKATDLSIKNLNIIINDYQSTIK